MVVDYFGDSGVMVRTKWGDVCQGAASFGEHINVVGVVGHGFADKTDRP